MDEQEAREMMQKGFEEVKPMVEQSTHLLMDAYEKGFSVGMELWQNANAIMIYKTPDCHIKDAVEVTSRMAHIDEDLKPIAEFIMEYAHWNLHTNEWNQPTLEVPLFRVLDALAQRGKPYCCAG